jgi:hypothetical protein
MIGPRTGGGEATEIGVGLGAEQALHFGPGGWREVLKGNLTNHLMG